jgi:hypothetical protein
MLSRKLRTKIEKAFEAINLTATFGEGWINIMCNSGTHCEFYTCAVTKDETYVTSTYTVDNKERELNYHLPSELGDFVAVVDKILKPYQLDFKPGDKIKTKASNHGKPFKSYKRGVIRRIDGDMALIEWARWSYICTWIFIEDLRKI